MHQRVMTGTTSAFAAVSVLLAANAAFACGGLFCSQAAPVVQTDEQIIFVDHGDGEVTAVVNIVYSGPAERFSWVVPVPGEPEIGLSSAAAFTALEFATGPQLNLDFVVEGSCAPEVGLFGGCANESLSRVEAQSGNYFDATVIGEGQLGPYDYTLLRVAGGQDVAADALAWLENNEYDVAGTDADLLRPYLEDGMNLLAFRLQKNAETGDIRPVTMRYVTERPMVPIKLTAVAAESDMGILTYVVAPARAVPKNFRALEPNLAKIDWRSFAFDRSQYRQLVSDAADEAGGHGFVTEYAKPATRLRQALVQPDQEEAWQRILNAQSANEVLEELTTWLVVRNQDGFAQIPWDGMLTVVREIYDVDTAGAQNILNCPSCSARPNVDLPLLKSRLEEFVYGPMHRTQSLLMTNSVLTRLYTTLSPDEMTEDPVFTYNADRGEVDNVHNATWFRQCHLGVVERDAPFRIEFDDGTTLFGSRTFWPDTRDLPANRRILVEGESGAPEVIVDNIALIDDVAFNAGSRSSGCTVRPYASFAEGAFLFVLLAGGRVLLRRRRR